MSIEETAGHLRQHWPAIREALLQGFYIPQAVRGVEIPKPGGGMRQLGIPTVTDRLIQQALLQVMQPILDPTFHPSSFGFRPGRSAHQAVRQAQRFVGEGRRIVVDVDLEKFFDRVNHDILMDKVAKRIEDKRVRKLIRRYLETGIMQQGVIEEREEGTPQGGPLSPLLANLLLNEVDWALEKRGLAFCRYADDCNVYVRSKAAANKVMQTMHKLMGKLKLKINSQKSAVAWVGYRNLVARGLAPKTARTMAGNHRSYWAMTSGAGMNVTFPIAHFDALGLIRLKA
jgi:group II intron reverse transcriptase/maturase